MAGTMAALALALSATGGVFFGEGNGKSLYRHLVPAPADGGFFFRHKDRAPLPVSQRYVQHQMEETPHHKNWILPPGPGNGWAFPNGNPDGYGYVDYGFYLPLGFDRTPDYFFPRYLSSLPQQCFLQSYYNPYIQRGQRYIPYTNCGGDHPSGGPPPGSSETPMHPDQDARDRGPVVRPPTFSGRVEAPPISSTNSGILP